MNFNHVQKLLIGSIVEVDCDSLCRPVVEDDCVRMKISTKPGDDEYTVFNRKMNQIVAVVNGAIRLREDDGEPFDIRILDVRKLKDGIKIERE